MRNPAPRNFTVRFLESALRRVETTAKPFYGGRLSTGEAIRRLAEERLEEIESKDGAEKRRDALLRILGDWRAGRRLAIADLRLIADGANAAYRRCRADVVSRDLLIANVSAFREAVKMAEQRTSEGCELGRGCYLENLSTSPGRIDGKSLAESVGDWIASLPDFISSPQAELASRNLLAFLHTEDCPDEGQLDRAIRPYLSSLLQLAIRAYWYAGRQPLLGPKEAAHRSPMTRVPPVRCDRITLKSLLRDHELALSLELPGEQSVVTANNFVEVEDLARIIRLSVEGHDMRGEVFQCYKRPEEPQRFILATDRGWVKLGASDVASVAQALEALFREPTMVALAERSRFIYGRL